MIPMTRNAAFGFFLFLAALQPQTSAKKEGKELAKSQAQILIDTLFSQQDEEAVVLIQKESLSENQVPLDPAQAKQGLKTPSNSAIEAEIDAFLKSSQPKEQLEGEEAVFADALQLINAPGKSIELISETTTPQPEEVVLETCIEKGCYQTSLRQQLKVKVSPEIKQQTKLCQGHSKTYSFTWKKDAKASRDKLKHQLEKDPTVNESHVHITQGNLLHSYVVESSWKHVTNTHCDNHRIEEKIIQAKQEADTWETDAPQQLETLQSDPDCQLLYTQVLEGPQTRTINGTPVYRELWNRQLIFSCGANESSKCHSMRSKGGVLIGKACLKESEHGECVLWEKTYDLGKRAEFNKTDLAFENEPIWGLCDTEDLTYEKNRDLPEVAAKISVFAEMEQSLLEDDSFVKESVNIMKGEQCKCQQSFVKGVLYDCCKKMDGLAVQTKLAHCSSDEQCLAQKRNDGKCHFIGTKKSKLGTETEQVFCCFPTKLARVLHEQGRKQLGVRWGKAEKPICRGFTLQELQSLNFDSLDLSEIIDDLGIRKEEFTHKIKQRLQNLQTDASQKGIPQINQLETLQTRTSDE